MHILLKAQYRPTEYKGVAINSGECVFGRKAWAKELGLSEQQIRTAISHLQSTNEITITSTNKFSVIHVVNWESWQIKDGLSTNTSTNAVFGNQPTTNQQLTTSKESKKVINKKNHSSSGIGKKTQDMTNEEKDEFLARARSKFNRTLAKG
jgi:hypothetical protein